VFVFLLTSHGGKLQLWDFDRIGKDKLIGTLRLPISKAAVQDSPPTPSWHTVHLELHETGSGAVNTTAVIQRPELLVGMQVRGALVNPCVVTLTHRLLSYIHRSPCTRPLPSTPAWSTS
jgi:hypothetical protein